MLCCNTDVEWHSSTAMQSSRRTRAQAARDRSAATRARIVAAAGPLFVERGYLDTTVSAIAKAGGVGAQTLELSFPGKIAILAAAVAAPGPDAGWLDTVRAERDGRLALAHHLGL